MLNEIIRGLPPEVQKDLSQRPIHNFELLTGRTPQLDNGLPELGVLASLEPTEVLEVLGRWTQYAIYIGNLLQITMAFEKRLEWHIRRRSAELRVELRKSPVPISNAEIEDSVATDPWLRSVAEVRQSILEIKSVLQHREGACQSAAEAASRTITAMQMDLQQRKLEARRA